MALRAVRDFDLCLSQCWMIGDSHVDLEMSQVLQIPFILVRTGYGLETEKDLDQKHQRGFVFGVADDLLEAALYIKSMPKTGGH